jgi:hypothetical protein
MFAPPRNNIAVPQIRHPNLVILRIAPILQCQSRKKQIRVNPRSTRLRQTFGSAELRTTPLLGLRSRSSGSSLPRALCASSRTRRYPASAELRTSPPPQGAQPVPHGLLVGHR